MDCPECHLEISEDSKFCKECGCHLMKPTESYSSVESERKHVTILFSDLSGYTAMTERLDPEEVKEIMSLIFAEITGIIKKYDGFIERFIGDAVMAVFGIPKAHEDDPVRAVRAALEIHTAVEACSPRYEKKIGRPLTMHTGINTGLVVTGEVDIEKGTHGLTGDAINIASRLEGIADAGEIIVGPDIYHQAANWFEFETREPTRVKGKSDPISIYRVVSFLNRQGAATQRLHGVQAELVGRETEMAILTNAVENLKQRKGSVISIVGHAGTGKSRLVGEFKDRLGPEAVQWREGHAYAYTQNMAYYPLTNLLTHAFQINEEDNPDQIRKKVETGVEALLWDQPEAKKYLGSLFSIGYEEIDKVSPEFWRNQLHKTVQQLLEAVASRGPTVALFEDLHWADGAFIELLHLLLENTHHPVLFLCVYRPSFSLFPEGRPDTLTWPHEKIDLQELHWDETEAMLQSLLQATHLPDELRYFIKQKVEGNPFYLEEVINTLLETGTLISDNGGWQLTKDLELADIPTTIQGVLTARLDRLEKQAKRILQEASVIGRAFFYKVLIRITKLTTTVDEYLSGLESLDLIRARSNEPDLEYIFKHALTQEVVYNGLLIKERRGIHERVGYVIEKLFHNRLPEFYETLAFHFKQGPSVDKAIHYLMKAGEKSLNRYALEESHQYYQEAFNLLTNKSGKLKTNEKLLIDLIIKWALAYYYRGDFKGLTDLLSDHEDLASLLSDNKRLGMYYAWYGFALFFRENNFKSLHYLSKALQIGEEIEDYRIIGYACTWLIFVKSELGLMEESIHLGERAHEVYRNYEADQYVYFKSLAGMAVTYWYRGDYKKILETGKALKDFGHKHSNIRSLTTGHGMTGMAYFMDGNFNSAIECFKMSMAISADPVYTQAFKVGLGLSYLLNGEFKKAEITLRESGSFCREFGYETYGAFAEMGLCVNQIVKGQMSKGFRKLKECQIAGLNNGKKFYHALVEYIFGKLYSQIALGEGDIKPFDMVKNIGFLIKNVPFARKKAETHFYRAITLAKEIGAKGLVGQAYLDLGILNKEKKRVIQAKECLSEAIGFFEKCESEVYLKQAEETLESLR